jgi:hypothetical protein
LWFLKTKDKEGLEAHQMRALRSVAGYTSRDHTRNKKIRKQLRVALEQLGVVNIGKQYNISGGEADSIYSQFLWIG